MITLALPMPPSVNRIWRPVYANGKAKFVKRDRYLTWRQAAHGYYLEQGGHRQPKITGHFHAHIVLDASKRGVSDADNRAKPVLDALQTFGAITNDKHCDRLTVEWGTAPAGCIVTLSPVE